MMDFLYMWISDISVYLVLVTAAMQIIPGRNYKKYIRFFSGLVFILLLTAPVFKLSGMDETFNEIFQNSEYEQRKQEIEKATEIFNESEFEKQTGTVQNNEENKSDIGKIHVEEIRIND